MLFGLLGDVHGDFDALNAIMTRHSEVAFWMSVGDLASDDLRYPDPPAPLYWIQGNNEDFNFIAGLKPGAGPRNLHFLPNGTCAVIHPTKGEKRDDSRPGPEEVKVGALGGTFAPTWYDTRAADLPYPGTAKIRDDKRRHFVREQVEALKLAGHVDLLLTHEAPRPFFVQAGPRRIDAGKTAINELLTALQPRLHFFGHHHRFSDALHSGVRSIGLDVISRSYVLVDRETFDVTKVEWAG